MSTLEELTPNAAVRGALPNELVTVVSVHKHMRAGILNRKVVEAVA